MKTYARQAAVAVGGVLILVLLVTMIVKTVRSHKTDPIAEDTQLAVREILAEVTATEEAESEEIAQEPTGGIGRNTPDENGWFTVGDTKILAGFYADRTDATLWPSEDEVTSTYAVLINESTNEIVAAKNEDTIISPASMTKILTVLVAAEHIEDLDDTFTMTLDITDYAYFNDCSSVGFLEGETVTVRDLFYGTILPSGGDAALALATYVAGSQDAFVEMMNEKLEELGLSETAHFTNCIGLYDENHYCTVYDMAMILKAAVENDWCREVLSTHVYTTASTEQHPDGITISNWFLRRIEDKDTGGEVLCAKTGFVNQSRNCAASYYISEDGTPYICVTADAHSGWRCIYDHVAMYSNYAK
jgi:D-alanyl-D-alanine carboxypeptidase (penicillin-binding protein 5/6)